MVECGLIDYWRKNISPSVKQCDSSAHPENGPHSIGMNDVQSPFLVWGIGVILSLLTFFIEICYTLLKIRPEKWGW